MNYAQNTAYAVVLGYLERSIKEEQIFCSIVTQMTFLPQFQNQAALNTVHRENYETSYHRNTAAGNLLRLIAGEVDEMLVLMTVECFIETRQHDKTAELSLTQLSVTSHGDDQWIAAAIKWHNRRKRHLKCAVNTLYSAIGSELWNKGAALSE